MPVEPVKLGVLGAVSTFSAGVAGGTAVLHVAAAHRLWRGQRHVTLSTGGALDEQRKQYYRLHYKYMPTFRIK